jgi:thiol-disulfide isomerase/thioredoxin
MGIAHTGPSNRIAVSLRLAARRSLTSVQICFAAALLGALLAPAALAGETLDLARYRGKVVLVDFWASWCKPCRDSLPWLNLMQEKYGPLGLVVIGVNVDRNRADAERFLEAVPARFQLLYDPDGVLAARYELMGMPSSLVFDPEGSLVASHVGFRNGLRDEREAELRRLLATAKPEPSPDIRPGATP